MEYSGAGGETDSWKEPEAKNLVTLSLLCFSAFAQPILNKAWKPFHYFSYAKLTLKAFRRKFTNSEMISHLDWVNAESELS